MFHVVCLAGHRMRDVNSIKAIMESRVVLWPESGVAAAVAADRGD